MNGNRYVDEIIGKYNIANGPGTPVYEASGRLRILIQKWYSGRLLKVHNSGSFAKGTSIRGCADLDLFISLKPRTGKSLRRIYEGLYEYAKSAGLRPRRQNVSIGVEVNNVKVDLVPARRHTNSDDHSLYRNRDGEWIKTNVARHIDLVRRAEKSPTIRVAKIWRANRGLQFPSFYLELTVLRALRGHNARGTATELQIVLEFLSTNFINAKFVDPANKMNMISDDLRTGQKQAIANQARGSLTKIKDGLWNRVVW